MLEEGVGNKDIGLPVLLVLNKKDLIKPGEIAKKLEVWTWYNCWKVFPCFLCAFLCMQLVLISGQLFWQWYQKFTNVDDVIPISAKFGNGVDDIKEWILSKLPLGPAYYPKVLAKIIHIFLMASPYALFTFKCHGLSSYIINRESQVLALRTF